MIKIFISHSSKNVNFGQAIVDLLLAVGVNSSQIIFTSNDAFGIPTGQNIFKWLKEKITEKPHVIYLLSPEYYSSIACLNEMGAAWIVENEHTIIFTPNFKSSSTEFQSGALDPREMGFKINNTDRMTEFIESLKKNFSISDNTVFINQKIRQFIEEVNSFESLKEKETVTSQLNSTTKITVKSTSIESEKKNSELKTVTPNTGSNSINKFLKDLQEDKLKDEEILLLQYINTTARYKLGVGWKSSGEIENIKIWEDVNSINSKLSSNYEDTMRRYEFKKLTEISELTSSNNPREVMLISDLREIILDLPDYIEKHISKTVNNNQKSISISVWGSSIKGDFSF
ncbi:toll/interleukin-1 receptor domain-containing protein [Myroides odoratimimus]|uniref:toll/interleukin-1 receptor domain-containing protein n=1 Tax=Myroides odoratimimus TaxID=76832 RepID=UPI0031016189